MARRRSSRRLRRLAVPAAVVLDSHALSAGAQGHARVRAELSLAERLGASIHVSTVTLAEVLRGHARDVRVHTLLSAVDKEAVTPDLGRAAGELLGRSRRDDTVDAIVAVTAESLARPTRLLTGDPADLSALAADMRDVMVVPI